MNPKLQALITMRDKLNADVGALQQAAVVADEVYDALTAKLTDADTAVVAAIATPAPPVVTLDFTAFDSAVAGFKAVKSNTQTDVDNLANVIRVNTRPL